MERYEAYNDSGIEWIGDIPTDWTCANLGAIAKQRKNPNKNGEVDNVLSLSYGSIRRRVMDNTGLLPESFNTYNVIEDGDVVLRLTDLQNDQRSLRVGLCHEQGIITSAYTTLEPQSIDSRYLFYSLAVFDYWKGFYGLAGGVRQSLTFDGIRSLRFPLPSRIEQQAIADYLDAKTAEIDALVADCEREVGLLREYRKAVISEAVTKGLNPAAPMKDSGIEWIGEIPEDWNVARLDGIAERKSGHTPDKKVPEYWDGSIVWISLADSQSLRSERYLNASNTMTTEAGIQNSSAELLPAGSVLLSRDASVGLTAIAGVPLAVSQHFMAYICGNGLYNEYLRYVFMAMHQEFERLSMGSTIPTIGLPLIKQLMIPYPPKAVQVEIVSCLDARIAEIDALIKDKQTMVDKLREYRKSLISEAVTGKFKVPGI